MNENTAEKPSSPPGVKRVGDDLGAAGVGRSGLASQRSARWAFMERFVVPDYDSDYDYLVRWRVIQTPWFGIYLHRFDTPDPRPTLHDHPWPFVSFVLRGGYSEVAASRKMALRIHGGQDWPYGLHRRVRWVNVKRTGEFHWISHLRRVPTWTLMFVGRRQRTWGYLDRDGTWTAFDRHPHAYEFDAAVERRRALGSDDPEARP